MAETLTESQKRERLHKLMEGFDTAMLVTRTGIGDLHCRPLAIAQTRDDGVMYFSTALDTAKVKDLQNDPHVCISLQDKRRFVSVTGRARIDRDRTLIHRLWSEAWKVWFPKGKDDPSLCILTVEPIEAQYWDVGGTEGLKYIFEAARAYLTGTRPDSDQDEHRTAKVRL
jgi:general stress protein 26